MKTLLCCSLYIMHSDICWIRSLKHLSINEKCLLLHEGGYALTTVTLTHTHSRDDTQTQRILLSFVLTCTSHGLEKNWCDCGTHLDFRHGDRDVLGLDGELHALSGVGGKALRLAGALAAVLSRATVDTRRMKNKETREPHWTKSIQEREGREANATLTIKS